MNIITLRDYEAFRTLSRQKLISAHFVGYWQEDGYLFVCKDRITGKTNTAISEQEFNKYIEEYAKKVQYI